MLNVIDLRPYINLLCNLKVMEIHAESSCSTTRKFMEGFLQLLAGNQRALPVRMAIAALLFYVPPSLAHIFRTVACASTEFLSCVLV